VLRLTIIVLAAVAAALPASASAQFDHRPVRFWSFAEVQNKVGPVVAVDDSRQGGRLSERHDFGPAVIEFTTPEDQIATGEIFSSINGSRWEVVSQSPSHPGDDPGAVKGGFSHLDHFESYEKKADDATLEISLPEAVITAMDFNGSLLPSECPPGKKCPALVGIVRFEARAYAESAGGDFFRTKGVAYISGHQGNWTIAAGTLPDAQQPLWEEDDFDRDPDADGTGGGSKAEAFLKEPLTLDVDLSKLRTGELFATHLLMDVQAIDHRGRESGVHAFLRDTGREGSGLIETTGLRRRGAPAFDPPPVLPPAPASCPGGPLPNAGTLQFSEPEYVADESTLTPALVLVTRTGGSAGQASATVTTSARTAEAGLDYTEVSTTVTFGDGDTTPRLVEIPVLQDELSEADETLDVTLSAPGCIALGAPAEAEVTIVDDDRVADDESFTIGGAVSGLAGSGLVLSNLGTRLDVPANGAFQFPLQVADGIPYDVTVETQPSNPDQRCTVANGSGTITGANVTDIVVECVTPPPPSGLDPAFDGDGIATKSVGAAAAEAVAIQADGMIVTAGGGPDFVLTRHDANGQLDASFGDAGVVTTPFPGLRDDRAFDVAVQPDGKIVAVGRSESPDRDFAIVRYDSEGTPDDTFGDHGIVTTDFHDGADQANGVAIDAQGRIVVAGHAQVPKGPGLGFENDFAVARYLPDGQSDGTFAGDGTITTDLGTDTDLGNDLALDAAGRIVVVGQLDNSDQWGLARYSDTGVLDTGFGPVVTSAGGSLTGVAIRSDGKIVVAGTAFGGLDVDFALAMYDDSGTLDTSIGDAGIVTTDVSGGRQFGHDFAADLVLDDQERPVVVGRNTSDTFNDLAIVRYTRDGVVDASFDGDGMLVVDVSLSGDQAQDVAIQADGKIVAAGLSGFGFTVLRALP
jgi:uncharacterized delta-60 repeat protein